MTVAAVEIQPSTMSARRFKTSVVCEKCKSEVVRKSHNQKYCESCREDIYREDNRKNEEKKRRASGVVGIGSEVCCPGCGKTYVKINGAQRDCLDCSRSRRLIYEHKSRREYERNRFQDDPAFRLNSRMKSAVKRGLKSGKEGRSWTELVGYSVEALHSHIEKQFSPGMSWDNMGEWHLDHRLPLIMFQFDAADDPEFKAAWALSNLQPLWNVDNLSKGGRRTLLI